LVSGFRGSTFSFPAFLDDKAASFDLAHDFIEDVIDDFVDVRVSYHIVIDAHFQNYNQPAIKRIPSCFSIGGAIVFNTEVSVDESDGMVRERKSVPVVNLINV
jgi:hypothetical protein